MSVKPRTLLLALIGLAAVGGLLVVAFRPDPVPVDLTTAARGPMQITINADGKTQIREIYEVAAPITGTAQRSPVEVGDIVRAGETVVAVVEPVAPSLLDTRTRIQAEAAVAEAEAGLNVAQSGVKQAEEDRAFAQSQFTRIEAMLERGVATVTQLESAAQQLAIKDATLARAMSSLDMAQGTLDRARAALIEPTVTGHSEDGACCVEIPAPIDGVVLSVDVISERPVTAGTPLLSIGQPDDLEIVADLLSSDAVRIPLGAPAEVDRWGGARPLEAQLRSIDPSARTKVSALGIEEQRVDAVFDLVSPPELRPGLGDGFAVFLRIVEWQTDDALQVPLSAVFRRGAAWAVFEEIDGVAVLREIEIGRRNGTDAQVLSGLEEGARIITHPSDDISEGVRIEERLTL